MTAYTIDIISDTVCPWCYIGHRRLTTAIQSHLATHPSDTFATRWHPYQLNPFFPRGTSIDKRDYYVSKFGEQRASMIFARLAAAGKECGVAFRFGGRTGNTWDSHRLVEFAYQKDMEKGGRPGRDGLQTRVVEELFADYFEKEQDITRQEVLVAAAERAGLDAGEVTRVLQSEELRDVVEKGVRQAKSDRISGVPHFTVQGQYEISGGQEPAAFLQIFERIKAREAGKVNGNA